MLEERAVEVSAGLRPWVDEMLVASMTGEQMVLDAPDAATTLVLRSVPGRRPELVVMGPRTQALYYLGRQGPSCVKVRLRPGRARLLLGRSARDLVDQVVPLGDLWGEPGQLLARHWADPVRFAEALVAGRSGGPADLSNSELVGEAARLLSTNDIRDSAKRLHVSERHLRNLFTEGVGMPPKRFARINRVRTVLAHAHTRPWSELALEAGYYDHSHMTAEFRRIMGVPPSAFLRGELPAARQCGPLEY
ncbi:AraC-like DNA-binding protein [Kibdelosporangium banguiense]|uniref:AraC-like DNA-binding protein n=1 Tax=Kibdelosporangium banguiense TaxID=1365924 RepID=A0ABS4TLB4_9PSEU|nr:helix-turn-helix domain-containing protein [Kibdelosporangium banguiense]MBP2325176.1 AraC-like DNA-binding protein [Kibdelosporangium banguiense]